MPEHREQHSHSESKMSHFPRNLPHQNKTMDNGFFCFMYFHMEIHENAPVLWSLWKPLLAESAEREYSFPSSGVCYAVVCKSNSCEPTVSIVLLILARSAV